MKLLLTGGMGFIGSHVAYGLLKETNWEIVILDRLDISGNPARLTETDIWEKEKHRVRFIWWDLKSAVNRYVSREIGSIDYIWHLAASSHVDRSIKDPISFVMDNVVGTTNLLLYSKNIGIKRFIYFSTDEVFGPLVNSAFKEWDRYKSSNPYAASKAGGEEMCVAFENTYKIPIIITHTMNVFGERQHPEKFIPLCIRKILSGDKILIHSDSTKTISGTRYWIHARNVLKALLFLNKNGVNREKYNIVGEKEISNLEMAEKIYDIIKHYYSLRGKLVPKLNYELVNFHSSRPGHDLRYGLDGTKLKEMGFEYPKTFEESLSKTIIWYLENLKWLNK